jgi:organic hydroperoxide reductase OsmC/OhrA
VNGRVGIDSLGLFGRTVPWKTRQPDDRHCSPSCGEPTELGTSTTRADHCSHRRGGSHRRRSSSPENQLRVPRRQLTLIVAALLASGLAGCSSNHGLEPLAARDRIQAVDGVTSATVTTGIDRQTLKTTHFIDVRLRLDGTTKSRDLSQLIEYAARVAWATEIDHEPTDVQVSVSSTPAVDTFAILQKLGLPASPASSDHSSALISARLLEEKWGRWPGQVPERLG